MKKICSKCNIEKDVCDFHKHNREKDGYYCQCKECRKIKSKNDYHKNKENDKLVITGKSCSYCFIEKDINLFHKQIGVKDGYRSTCKECRSIIWKENYSKVCVIHNERTKKYRVENKEKYNNYFRSRYKKIPHQYAWRSMLSSMLRRFNTRKQKTTIEILGYSAEDLKNHMESLFLDGMNWDNWGLWEIDHIRPISSYDKDTDPKIVNELSNLQPLWAKDNLKKRDKF